MNRTTRKNMGLPQRAYPAELPPDYPRSRSETIGPTPERLRRAIGEDGKPAVSEVDLGENVNWKAFRLNDAPLGRLLHCKHPKITVDQFNAGESYHAVVYYTGMMASGVVDPSRVVVDGGQHKHIPDRLIAAKARYEIIIKRMPYELHHIVDAVVVQEIPLAEYAERFTRIKKRPTRQAVALDRLCMGLDWLVSHFDIGRKPVRMQAHVGEMPVILPPEPPETVTSFGMAITGDDV